MILTGPEISKERKAGKIQIDPFDERLVNPNSYNFRLGSTIMWYKNHMIDVKERQDTEVVKVDEEGFVLENGRVYLGHTLEVMGSDYYVPIIRGRSSTARIGLFVHVTADLIDIGSHNQWTLQLHAVQPVKVYPRMIIGQVTFWCVKGDVQLYSGKYQGSVGPKASEIYLDFLGPQT